jgi:hypothetical protein
MSDFDLFAQAEAARDAAIAKADASVQRDQQAELVVERVTQILLHRLHEDGRREFTADEVGGLLDALSVATDQSTRRRLVSTIINRGKGKLWRANGWTPSVRRHSSPIALWQLVG